MAKKELYHLPFRLWVKDIYEFFVIKNIKNNKHNIFEFFSVTQQFGHCMVEFEVFS